MSVILSRCIVSGSRNKNGFISELLFYSHADTFYVIYIMYIYLFYHTHTRILLHNKFSVIKLIIFLVEKHVKVHSDS